MDEVNDAARRLHEVKSAQYDVWHDGQHMPWWAREGFDQLQRSHNELLQTQQRSHDQLQLALNAIQRSLTELTATANANERLFTSHSVLIDTHAGMHDTHSAMQQVSARQHRELTEQLRSLREQLVDTHDDILAEIRSVTEQFGPLDRRAQELQARTNRRRARR